MNSSSDSFFCPIPFIAVDISSNGEVGFCCDSKETYRFSEPIEPMDILSSEEFEKTRRVFLNNAIPLGCRSCAKSEHAIGTSRRIREIERYKREEYGPALKKESNPSSPINTQLVPELRSLNYRLGNKCNLKCLMCNPGSSHLIALEEHADLGDNNPKIIENQLVFKEQPQSLRSLYFGGGEPFLSKDFEQTLLHFSSKGSEQIDVLLNTNLTTINPRVLELLENFKSAYFGVSIDGTETVFEYIRHPHQWQKLNTNIEYLLKNTTFEVSCHVTLSCLNLANLKSIIQYKLKYPKLSLKVEPISEPYLQRIENLKPEAVQNHLSQLKEIIKGNESKFDASSLRNLNKLVKFLENLTSTHSQNLSEQILKFLKKKDQLRGTNYQLALPYLAEELF